MSIITLADAAEQYRAEGKRPKGAIDWNDDFLDEAVGPLTVGGLFTFAARKGTGKSFSLLYQLSLLDCPSLFISCEDPLAEIGRRAAEAGLSDAQQQRIQVYVPARPRLSLITHAMRESKARVVAIDYVQVVQEDTGLGTFDRAGQVRNIVTELLGTARETGQSVLLAAQLKRPQSMGGGSNAEDEGRPSDEKRGTIYEIRDSSDLENQSTAVILVHRLGRLFFDQTVAAVKSRIGGERRKFERGPGGWPVPVHGTASDDAAGESPF